MDDTKVNWYATVHTPAAVTIHSENSKKPDNTTSNKKLQRPNKTHKNKQRESDRRSSSETIDEGEVMHCINSGIGMAEIRQKRNRKHQKHIAIPPSEWNNTALCGKPDPRDHIEQAIKAQQLTIKEHFDASNDNAM